jgi:hypothetical protein
MKYDIDKLQLSSLGKLQQQQEINMTKEEVIKELLETRIINSGMLKVLKMPFEVWLKYCGLKQEAQTSIANTALDRLRASLTFCAACECDPCDCGYESY